MTDVTQPDATITPWNLFVLAACARLGPFPQVHLSPRIAGQDLGIALRAKLPMEPSEFIVATVDHAIGAIPCPVVLTNRRLFWFERTDDHPESAKGPTIRGAAVEYVLLGDEIIARAAAGGGGGVELDLGGGRIVRASSAAPELGLTLAETLRELGAASRAAAPPQVEPERARRIAEAFPGIVEADRRLRSFGADIANFHADLLAATPSTFVTYGIVAACVGVFGVMTATGVDPMTPGLGDLLAWGANDAVRVALGGETWRLPASVFLHGGLIHLAVNMWALMNIGPLVERFYGNLGYAALYLAAGVGGAIASMATPPARVSVGASGAIFGVLGALLAFLLVHRRAVPATVLRPLRSSALGFVVFNTLLGAVIPMIDQAAHMGGLATGFLAGLVLARPWPAKRSTRGLARSVVMSGVVAAVMIGVGEGAVRWRSRTLDARDRFGDFARRIGPAYRRFVETAKGNEEVVDLLNRGEEADAKARLPEVLARLDRLGRANLTDVERVRPYDPKLRQIADLLTSAQREQVAGIAAVQKFEETGDRAWLEGPDGFVNHVAASVRQEKERRELERAYLGAEGLGDLESDEEADER